MKPAIAAQAIGTSTASLETMRPNNLYRAALFSAVIVLEFLVPSLELWGQSTPAACKREPGERRGGAALRFDLIETSQEAIALRSPVAGARRVTRSPRG